jgi:hypothetical protein
MMHDDDVIIQEKATILYHRLDDLTVNGDLTIEQFAILDNALALWVEWRKGLAEEAYRQYSADVDAESYVTDPEEWKDIIAQAEAEEESRERFYAWVTEQEVERIQHESMSEERI